MHPLSYAGLLITLTYWPVAHPVVLRAAHQYEPHAAHVEEEYLGMHIADPDENVPTGHGKHGPEVFM